MKVARIVAQALPVILLALLGTMVSGGLLGAMGDLLEDMPGLLVMVPALLALRGHIHAALGSRLSSAVHLGIIPRHVPYDEEVRKNIAATLILSLVMGAFAGGLAHGTNLLFDGRSIGLALLVALGGVVGLVSAILMVPLATRTVRISFRKGIDPDNVVAPILLTFGDIITAGVLFVAAGLLHRVVVVA